MGILRDGFVAPPKARLPGDLRANASAATAAVLYGASVVVVRVAVREVAPVSLAVLRFGQGALLLAGVLLVVEPRHLRVGWGRLRLFGLLGAVLFVLFPLTFNIGLQYTEASRGAVILATMPIWSARCSGGSPVNASEGGRSSASGSRWLASAWRSSNPAGRSAATPGACSVMGSCSSPGCSVRCIA